MDVNQQKEQFSISYIRAIAAVAGYSLYRPEVDNVYKQGNLIYLHKLIEAQ